jgi:flavodoxin
MKAIVVYESLWGNTEKIARAVAEGLGEGARAVPTERATPDVVAAADLVVAGAPVLGFRLATDEMRANLAVSEDGAPTPPDLDHPSLRHWLRSLPAGDGRPAAAFETRIWWSPRGATGDIERALREAGYEPVGDPQKFIVRNKYGPLRAGEVERARAWGATLAAPLRGARQEVPA